MSVEEEGVYRAFTDHLYRMSASGSLDELFKSAITEALTREESWRASLINARAELQMVRDVLTELGPVGIMPAEEQCLQPGQEGAAQVEAIRKLFDTRKPVNKESNRG